MESSNFYTQLICHDTSVSDVLGNSDAFERLPIDWHIIVTDIENSTVAVKNGLSEIVNLIASGSIIAALNIASNSKIDIPFFFGGDGATILVPPALLDKIMTSLHLYQRNIKGQYNLDLRVGSISVSTVYNSDSALSIAKVRINPLFSIPIVLGNGLQLVDKLIKSSYKFTQQLSINDAAINLEGMECRWNKIPPPKNSDEVVCLLISATEESDQAIIYKSILDKAEGIYGSHVKRNPISTSRLRLNVRLQKIRNELKLRHPTFSIIELLKNWAQVIFGKYWYLSSKPGQQYLNELVQLSDIFVLDGRINMIISGNANQRMQLVSFLDALESDHAIIYGIHVSEESIISCYVRNRDAQHIHFVDGADSGYTKAATLLKAKLSK